MDPLEIIKRDKKKWDKQLELVENQLTKIKDVLQKIDDALRIYYNEVTDEMKEQLKDPLPPKAGAVFSGIGKNHVGIVLKVDGYNITIQDGNYDGITNTFEDAKKDWQTNTYTLDYYRLRMGCIIFANPK